MPVNPSEIALFKLLEERASITPQIPLGEQTIEDFRKGTDAFLEFAGEPADVSYAEQKIEVRDGYLVPIRIYNSDLNGKAPVLIMYPGCGYILDLYETNAIACSRVAKAAGIKVVIGNFRLAPEHPLPTPIYDAYDVTQFIATHGAAFNIDEHKIFIGGISSGAHCAAVIANLARKDKSFSIYHQILLNGLYDLTFSTHDYDAYEKEEKLCSHEAVDFIVNHFGITKADYTNPLFSPYYESDLTGLPPTTIIVGEYDGLRNNSEAYYTKLKQVGNRIEKIVLPGQTHNTFIMRKAMTDGEDPAVIIANIIKRNLTER